MLANSRSAFDEVSIQSNALEQKYSIPQQQTQLKDIQLRIQRVSRLIQVNLYDRFILYRFVFYIIIRKHLTILI